MSDNEDEEALQIDFTEQSQSQRRQVEQGYSSSRFFSDGTLHDKFVTQLSADIDQPITRIRKRYAEYLAVQIQYLADDWSLGCWTDNAARTVAEELVNQYNDDEFDAIRRKFLAESTDQQLWGQNRYQYVRRQFALELLERVGAEKFRRVIDVRPQTQFEIHYPEHPTIDTKLFTVDKIDEVAVRQILEALGISKRKLARAALPFHSRLDPGRLVDWTTRNIKDYSNMQELLSNRWHYAVRYPTSLSVNQFTAVVLAAVKPEGSSHTVRDFISDIRSQSPKQEISARQLTRFISETSLLPDESIDLFNQILSGALHPDSRPVNADNERGDVVGKATGGSDRDIPAILNEKTPARMDDNDRAYTRLFIIRVAGKPAEIKPREITSEKLNHLDGVEGMDQLKETYTAYAAPASQHRAVSGMSAGDIVLFATEESEYVGEYHIEHVLIAPKMVRKIWDDLATQENGPVRIPFLLLLSRPRIRSFTQQRLNQLLGYRSTSTPSHWGVAQDRVNRLTDTGGSLEEILRRLDQD